MLQMWHHRHLRGREREGGREEREGGREKEREREGGGEKGGRDIIRERVHSEAL